MNTVAAGDKVWVKADGDYTETVQVDTAGGPTAPIVFEGYTSTIGDGGKATIDATGETLAISSGAVGNIYYVFQNLKFEDATSHGMSMVDADRFICKNCEFNSNGAAGAFVGNGVAFENCLFSGNTGDGLNTENNTVVVGCRFFNQGLDGLETDNGAVIIDCVFFSNAGHAMNLQGGSNYFVYVVYGCTVDGDDKDTGIAINFPGGNRGVNVAINNILYDCVAGISGLNQGVRFISRNNLVNDNTSDYGTGLETFLGEVTTAPVFTAEGSDFTLQATSPAKGAGYDGSILSGDTPNRDMGAHQAASGGLGGANKRAGKQ
jgi:hypothetical protein